MNLRRLLATTLGVGAVTHGLASLYAQRLQSQPDPIPHDQLVHEPDGVNHTIERPDGTQIHARTSAPPANGSEPPTVVLVHGYGVTQLEWSLVWPALRARGYRVVAFDMRGHGRSTIGTDGATSTAMAADILAVFEALDLRDAILVGHSTGGFLSIRALLDHPELVERTRGFVAFATLAGEALRGSIQNRLNIPMIRFGLTQRIASSPVYRWPFGAAFFGDDKPPSMIRALVELLAAQDHRALLPLLDALTRESDYDRLHSLATPTVVICGERDGTTPRWHSEQLGVRIPTARNVWVPDKGHVLNWEAPESLVEAVESLARAPTELS